MTDSPPSPPSPETTDRMRRIRTTGTHPEMELRRVLHARGLRYRVNSPIDGLSRRIRPDIVFRGPRVAVFVDGCFWHGCPQHFVPPKKNTSWWTSKIADNSRRDHRIDLELATIGWAVVRVWEHEPATSAAERVVRIVDARRKQ